MQSKITIAIQRKGRLYENSKNLLIKSGINFSANGERLLARSSNMNIDILLVRDDDIPSLVSKGVADLGIVGENVLAEQAATNNKITAKPLLKLGFSKCKLAFAKPLNSKLFPEIVSVNGEPLKLLTTSIMSPCANVGEPDVCASTTEKT